MKHFLLEKEPDKNGIIKLSGTDYRYLVRVLRLATGECFPVALPDGTEALARIQSIGNAELVCKVSPFGDAASEAVPEVSVQGAAGSMPSIILFQALPKGEKMDLIVRQAAESGLAEIVPFVSERTVAKVRDPQAKQRRWERIIKEARQQSGSPVPTVVRSPLSFDKMISVWEDFRKNCAGGILFHHEPLEQASLHSYLNTVPSILALAIGPEGGFSGQEVNLFTKTGFKPITIGNTVLRTETAALYCAAAVKIILLERDSWTLKQAKAGSELNS